MTTLTQKNPMRTPKIWTPKDATHEYHASGNSLKKKTKLEVSDAKKVKK